MKPGALVKPNGKWQQKLYQHWQILLVLRCNVDGCPGRLEVLTMTGTVEHIHDTNVTMI
jgi:hypothetical protein